jgi:hypothetical protein
VKLAEGLSEDDGLFLVIRTRDTDEVVVIDFKSNDRTQAEELTDLQLQVYALGARAAGVTLLTASPFLRTEAAPQPRVSFRSDYRV